MAKIKKLVIPNHLEEEFKNFLDIALCNLPVPDDDPDYTKNERQIIKIVRKYVG